MKRRPLRLATCCMAGTLLITTPVYASSAAGQKNASVQTEVGASAPVAGVSLEVLGYLEKSAAGASNTGKVLSTSAAKVDKAITVDNKKVTDKKGNKNGKTEDTGKQDTKKDSKDDRKKSDKNKKTNKNNKLEAVDYKNMAVAQVDDYVNIRRKPSEDGKLLGKLHSNSVAKVLKKKGGWYKIKSGSVTGYVKGDYISVGDEKLIKSVSTQIATVNTTTLKVRSKASTKADVLTLVPDGEELSVASMKDYKDGWVKVKVDGGKGYVSADYVEISREFTYAESRAEEEARIAAEEARKAAEEEQRRAAQAAAESSSASTSQSAGATSSASSSTSSSASSSSASQGSSSSASQPSSATSSSTSSSAGSSSSASSVSASGQAVVNYASQFLGNPYVYGGSSLTNGTDCSGFVMSVYAHFGVSLPHSSGAQSGVGRGVSYEDRQPGDIICYDGHVAIYVGNDTVIHASNPASGIKYTSPANYRTVVAVRRIF